MGHGASSTDPGKQSLYFLDTESKIWQNVSPKSYAEDTMLENVELLDNESGYGTILKMTFPNEWMKIGLRKI